MVAWLSRDIADMLLFLALAALPMIARAQTAAQQERRGRDREQVPEKQDMPVVGVRLCLALAVPGSQMGSQCRWRVRSS